MSNPPSRPVALVTGCSSGIGRATALRLRTAGLEVYASARRPERIEDLLAAGMKTVALDIADEESMRAAVEEINASAGRLDVLVNNAGIKVLGPVEDLPMSAARAQLEANMIGYARLIQLVLPGMRERRFGRIVNLSSVYGRFAVPGGAYPAAANHAITGFTDALRLEVAPFNIGVSLIEPGATRGTRLHLNAIVAEPQPDDPYFGLAAQVVRWHSDAIGGDRPKNIPGRFAVTADDVARVITHVVTTRRPKARYPVGFLSRALFVMRRLLPQGAFEVFVRNQFPLPTPGKLAETPMVSE